VLKVTARDLSQAAVSMFRRLATESRRLNASILRESAAGLPEKLNLFDDGRLKRAAVLLFHPDPEQFITGAFVRIG
jgi:ATP-dependent DNA helicase RecG